MKTHQQQQAARAYFARRRGAGVCRDCNTATAINPRSGTPRLRCPVHSAQCAAASRRYQAGVRQRWVAQGCCDRCGAPCGRNPQTGAAYRSCLRHRLMNIVRVRAYAYRRRFEVGQTQHSADEARLFTVIGGAGKTQTQIRREARMDTGCCHDALQRLVARGAVVRFTAKSGERGRPSWLYRRVQATQEAA